MPHLGRFTPRKLSGIHCIGDWLGPKPVLAGAENLASIGIRSPDRPALSESYLPLYPGPQYGKIFISDYKDTTILRELTSF